MRPDRFDLVVIGSGAAAASCWSAAVKKGKRVAVFESEALGGECPNFACVPTKALLHCAEVYTAVATAGRFGIQTGPISVDYARVKAWKNHAVSRTGAALGEQPYRDAGVTVIHGRARFVSPSEVEANGQRYAAERFLIATGARQVVPEIPGLRDTGYLTYREAVDLSVPPPSLLVLGGGPVGCELGHLFSTFGSRVVIADRNPRLIHREDPEAGDFLAGHFRRRGVDVRLDTGVVRIEPFAQGKRAIFSGSQEPVLVSDILVAAGKVPDLDLGLEAAGVESTRDGIVVSRTLQTKNPIVYAAGDVVGPYRFTHAAAYQGRFACDNMFGSRPRPGNYSAMPRCIFTSPEVAAVGLTEQQVHEQGVDACVGRVGIDSSDRAMICGRTNGFVKVIADPTGRLLGGTIVADRAGEVAQELALAVSLGASAAQLAETIHAFPTYSEALAAACGQVARGRCRDSRRRRSRDGRTRNDPAPR